MNDEKSKVVMSTELKVVEGGLEAVQQIQKSEDVKKGTPFSMSKERLNEVVVAILSSDGTAPLDACEKVKIVKQEQICVPSFLFYFNASADVSYEVGNERQTGYAEDLGDKVREVHESWKEYQAQTHRESLSSIAFTSGNKNCAKIIQDLYIEFDTNQLVNFEDLNFSDSIKTVKYDLAQAESFNNYIKSPVENALKQKAIESLDNQDIVNLSIHGCNIQKDEVIKVFLGIYHIVYSYNGMEYSIFITANGDNFIYDNPPIDEARKKFVDDKQSELAMIGYPSDWHKILKWIALIGFVCIPIQVKIVPWVGFFAFFISLPLWIILKIIYHIKCNGVYKKRDILETEISEYCKEVENTADKFLNSEKMIEGV